MSKKPHPSFNPQDPRDRTGYAAHVAVANAVFEVMREAHAASDIGPDDALNAAMVGALSGVAEVLVSIVEHVQPGQDVGAAMQNVIPLAVDQARTRLGLEPLNHVEATTH